MKQWIGRRKTMKRAAALMLACLLCLSLFACSRTEPEPPEEEDDPPAGPVAPQPDPQPDPDPDPAVTVEERSLSKTYTNDAGDELLRVSAVVPCPAGSDAMEQIAAYYEAWLDDIEYYCETMLVETATEGLAWAKESESVFNPYAFESAYQVTRSDAAVFSVMRDQYESTGGVHPAYTMLAETFDASNGGRLSVFTLFSSMEQQEVLTFIRGKVLPIAKRKLEAQPDLYYENYEELLMDAFDPLCFAMTDTGLTLYWQTYAIGPYVSGVQRFDISYEELDGVMDAQWMPS